MNPILCVADGDQVRNINCAVGVAPRSHLDFILTINAQGALGLLIEPQEGATLGAPLTRHFDTLINANHLSGVVVDIGSFMEAALLRGVFDVGTIGYIVITHVFARLGELSVMFEGQDDSLLLKFSFQAPDGPEYCGRMVLSEEEAEAYFDFTDDTVEIPEPMPHWVDEGLADGATIP